MSRLGPEIVHCKGVFWAGIDIGVTDKLSLHATFVRIYAEQYEK